MFVILISLLAFWTIEISATIGRTLVLNNGNIMPTMGFGTFVKSDEINDTEEATLNAIKAGFRYIDTSLMYLTEPGVGRAIKTAISGGIVTREDLFITTKMDIGYTRGSVLESLNRSLAHLQLGYVDLYLVHFSYNVIKGQDFDVVDVWKGMEDALRSGLVRSAGLANHNSSHINRILTEADIIPAVNQIEVNPTYTNLELVAYCQTKAITVLAYGPHGRLVPRPFLHSLPPPPTFDDPLLVQIADKYGKSTNQVVLRYLLERGLVPIPKSYTNEHTVDNIDVYDFSLTPHEVNLINEFNRNDKVFDVNSLSADDDIYEYYYNQTVREYTQQLELNKN